MDVDSDESFAPDSEASTLDEETSSDSVGSPVVVDNDTPPLDVYWNEYGIDEDEEQKTRSQCPACRHICS